MTDGCQLRGTVFLEMMPDTDASGLECYGKSSIHSSCTAFQAEITGLESPLVIHEGTFPNLRIENSIREYEKARRTPTDGD